MNHSSKKLIGILLLTLLCFFAPDLQARENGAVEEKPAATGQPNYSERDLMYNLFAEPGKKRPVSVIPPLPVREMDVFARKLEKWFTPTGEIRKVLPPNPKSLVAKDLPPNKRPMVSKAPTAPCHEAASALVAH